MTTAVLGTHQQGTPEVGTTVALFPCSMRGRVSHSFACTYLARSVKYIVAIVSIYKTFFGARLSQPLNVLSLCASAGFAHPPGHDIQPQRTARHALHSLSKKIRRAGNP